MSAVPSTGIVRKYYEEAEEDIEYRSSAFWQVWLKREFAKNTDELDLYAVTSESSPDGSRRRVDQVVKRYDPSHHTLSALIWNECKRPSGSAKEAEQQALDAARRCIQKENLLWIYALATVGVTFRVWQVWKNKPELKPLNPNVNAYVSVDSDFGWVLKEAIQQIKSEYPLGDAPVVPSQTYLLEYAAEEGQSSMQNTQQWYADEEQQIAPATLAQSSFSPVGTFEPPMPPSVGDLGQQEGQSSIHEAYYGDEAPGSDAVVNAGARSVETWFGVKLTRVRHMTTRDEYVFTTTGGPPKVDR